MNLPTDMPIKLGNNAPEPPPLIEEPKHLRLEDFRNMFIIRETLDKIRYKGNDQRLAKGIYTFKTLIFGEAGLYVEVKELEGVALDYVDFEDV